MKTRVLFDTNVILDFLLERKPFFREATIALDIVAQGKVSGYVAAHAITTIFYILSRKVGPKKTTEIVAELLQKLSVAAVTENIIQQAIHSDFKDFEDAVTHYAAIEEKASLIVTRNAKDFSCGQIPVALPEVFIAEVELP